MGGGRDKDGSPIYRRRNGMYERIDGKPIRRKNLAIKTITERITLNQTSKYEKFLNMNDEEKKQFVNNATGSLIEGVLVYDYEFGKDEDGLGYDMSKLPEKLQIGGSSETQLLVYALDLNDKPTVLDHDNFVQYVQDNGLTDEDIFTRSTHNKETLTNWIYDDLNYIGGRFGGNKYGNGTYFAQTGGTEFSKFGNNSINAVLKPNAKILDASKKWDIYNSLSETLQKAIGYWDGGFGEPLSMMATILGYDAIRIPNGGGRGKDYLCVINRSALIVDEKIF